MCTMSGNRVINNAKWIIACKIAQSLLQLVIGMLSARYLGPANYGLINYARSVVSFVVPLMQLGLNATIAKELIDSPEKEGEIMGTSLFMALASGTVCVMLVSGFVSITNRGQTQTLLVCLLYSLSLVFQAIELIQYWFHSKLRAKYPSLMMLCAYVVVSIYKIYLLVSAKGIYWFALVNSIEYGIIGISLLVIYHGQASQKLRFSFVTAKQLFSRSRYYILASMMVTVFQNTDHIMLKMMAGDAENGYYSAAITCAAVFQFVYAAIVDSMRPVILSCKKEDSADYEKNISRLYCVTIYMALLQALGFTLFARPIVGVLYGEQYRSAVPVLRILVWYISFSYMGTVRNIWILAEGKQRFLWKINLAGVAANIVLNFALIPVLNACGAAIASLLTQVFTNFVFGFLYKPLQENNRLLLKGFDPRLLLDALQNLKFRIRKEPD